MVTSRVLDGVRIGDDYIECIHCGAQANFTRDQVLRDSLDSIIDEALDLVPCQGSDDCTTMLCRDCVTKCDSCDLPTCAEHLAPPADDVSEKFCAICRANLDQAEPYIPEKMDIEESLMHGER